jgi:hypothetical protein
MRLYYISSLAVLSELPNVASHWMDLGNGHVLMAVAWDNDFQEQAWAEKEGVMPLPHPIFKAKKPLSDVHLGHLTRRFPKLEQGHNIHHLIKVAARDDPWFRCHVL